MLNPRGITMVLLLVASALAQVANPRLEGVVQDPSGATVPGAALVADKSSHGSVHAYHCR